MQIQFQLFGQASTVVVSIPPNTPVELLPQWAKECFPSLNGHCIQLADTSIRRKGLSPVFCAERPCGCGHHHHHPGKIQQPVEAVLDNNCIVTILLCFCDRALHDSIPLLLPTVQRDTVRTQHLTKNVTFLLTNLMQGRTFGLIARRTHNQPSPRLDRKWLRTKSNQLQTKALAWLEQQYRATRADQPAAENQPPPAPPAGPGSATSVAPATRCRKRPASVLETDGQNDVAIDSLDLDGFDDLLSETIDISDGEDSRIFGLSSRHNLGSLHTSSSMGTRVHSGITPLDPDQVPCPFDEILGRR